MKTSEDPKDHWHTVPVGITGLDVTGFGMSNGRLRVVFEHNGKVSVYQYTTNETDMCCRWSRAESIGQFFHRYVRPLPYAKIS